LNKAKITYLAIIRNILAEERYSRQQAKECARSKDKDDRELVAAYNSDADDYKKLAKLVKAKKWKEAFKFWEELDTFVREGVPSVHARWIAEQIK
jgi:hypothetical protein